jgi:hypothetical protein
MARRNDLLWRRKGSDPNYELGRKRTVWFCAKSHLGSTSSDMNGRFIFGQGLVSSLDTPMSSARGTARYESAWRGAHERDEEK